MTRIEQIIGVLDSHDSLDLGESPWGRNIDPEQFDIYQVDWGKLFPKSKPEDQGDFDWDIYGDGWDLDAEEFDDILTKDARIQNDDSGGWDTCAWYQPIHFFAYDWGIFIKEDCIRKLAGNIYQFLAPLPGFRSARQSANLVKALLRVSFSAYYHHEIYHHKTECMGLRAHAIEKRSSYLSYFSHIYKPTAGSDYQIEEAIANAFMYRALDEWPWISPTVAKATRQYLLQSFPANPPGYRLAANYLNDKSFENGQHTLFSQFNEASLNPVQSNKDWLLAPRLNHSIFNISADVWTVVRRGSHPVVPATSMPVRTCSTRDMIKICGRHGYQQVPGGKGSHVKLKKAGANTIILPGDRSNLSPGVAKNVLAVLGDYKIGDLNRLI